MEPFATNGAREARVTLGCSGVQAIRRYYVPEGIRWIRFARNGPWLEGTKSHSPERPEATWERLDEIQGPR